MAATFVRRSSLMVKPLCAALRASPPHLRQFSSLLKPSMVCGSTVAAARAPMSVVSRHTPQHNILQRVSALVPSLNLQPSRSLTYYGVRKGKRKSVRAVTQRFMRLHCGLWIRRKAGYKKKLWKKSAARRGRLREIVFCNKTQSKLLDKMTGPFWKRRNWYLDDPYFKYQNRVNLKV